MRYPACNQFKSWYKLIYYFLVSIFRSKTFHSEFVAADLDSFPFSYFIFIFHTFFPGLKSFIIFQVLRTLQERLFITIQTMCIHAIFTSHFVRSKELELEKVNTKYYYMAVSQGLVTEVSQLNARARAGEERNFFPLYFLVWPYNKQVINRARSVCMGES